MAGDNFELPNTYALLLIILVGLTTIVAFAVYTFRAMVRCGTRRSGNFITPQYLAALAAGAAIAMYAWGALHMLMDETAADQACKAAVGPVHAGDIDRYEPSFIPLRFGCHVAGDGTYEAAVPGYVNPAVLGLALAAIVLAIFAVLESSGRKPSNNTSTGKQDR